MDMHRPKPVHGWRELLREFGIIVLGVLTALSAEQAVVAIHSHYAAAEAREAIRAEIRQNLSFMRARMATQSCIERRLDEIGDLLSKAAEGPLAPRPSWVGQPSVWALGTQRWEVATNSGRTSLFDVGEQERFARIYVTTARFTDAEVAEQQAWAQLRGLETWEGPLGSAGRVHFLSALQTARYELWETRVAMDVAAQRASALGIQGNMATAIDKSQHVPHAVCLPINTPRARALTLLQDSNSAKWGQPK